MCRVGQKSVNVGLYFSATVDTVDDCSVGARLFHVAFNLVYAAHVT